MIFDYYLVGGGQLVIEALTGVPDASRVQETVSTGEAAAGRWPLVWRWPWRGLLIPAVRWLYDYAGLWLSRSGEFIIS